LKWLADRARAREAFTRGNGPAVWGFNKQDYRKFRILDSIFLEVQKNGVKPCSRKCSEFHFEYQTILTGALLIPTDRYGDGPNAKLKFIILDPVKKEASPIFAEWTDGEICLEDRIPEIVAGILAATRAAARVQRDHFKSLLDKEHLAILDALRRVEKLGGGNGYAARCDPRTFEALAQMAEQHRSATLVRRFLRSLSRSITDGSITIADQSLNDWMSWALAKADEQDPLLQGAEAVFKKLVRG
jgi:hypothetical protein